MYGILQNLKASSSDVLIKSGLGSSSDQNADPLLDAKLSAPF